MRSTNYRKGNLDGVQQLLRGSRSMDITKITVQPEKFQRHVEEGHIKMEEDGVSLPGEEDGF